MSDVALYLGEVMISRRPTLKWALHTSGKRNVNYHWPVIVGFDEPKRAVALERLVGIIAHRATDNLPLDRDEFVQLVKLTATGCSPRRTLAADARAWPGRVSSPSRAIRPGVAN